MILTILFLSFVLIPQSGFSQRGVNFRPDYYLEKAIQIAQIEDKNIFIDTYTPWCGPCKKMDIQFQDHALGAYFNKNYINIKINMDSEYGPAVKIKYDVFFLPTLIIVDKYGNVKYASTGTLTSDELLALGKSFHDEIYNDVAIQEKPSKKIPTAKSQGKKDVVKAVPPAKQKEIVASSKIKKLDPKEVISIHERNDPASGSLNPTLSAPTEVKGEKILYTQNDAQKNPEYLYSLTYLKLQLQDGTQWAAADEYLATQKDWSTLKNMRFIYDFVRSPNTKMFDHIISNRSEYDVLFGKGNVDRSISIMITMRLYQGYPRPDQKEVLQLYNLIDPNIAEYATYNYLLERFELEENYEDYVPLALKYVTNYAPDDFATINKIAIFSESSTTNLSTNELIAMMQHAIDVQGGTYYVLYDTIAALYFKKGNKKKALINIEKALELANGSGVQTKEILQLKEMIMEL